jgi:hypothetical protein
VAQRAHDVRRGLSRAEQELDGIAGRDVEQRERPERDDEEDCEDARDPPEPERRNAAAAPAAEDISDAYYQAPYLTLLPPRSQGERAAAHAIFPLLNERVPRAACFSIGLSASSAPIARSRR